MLCWARLMVEFVPFDRWRDSLGAALGDRSDNLSADAGLTEARRLAVHVDRAAARLPFATKCLPRAMALSWMLRHRRMGHAVVIAVRPPQLRDESDALHAWVEVEGAKILGELPGPWLETLRLGA